MAGENDKAATGGPAENPAGPGFARQQFRDPLDGPEAVRLPGSFLWDFVTAPVSLLATVSGVAVFFVLAANFLTPTMGARRSVRLKWQERRDRARAEVEATVREAESAEERKP